MCTDFTSLNKACPKDFYLLPCLGRLVDGSAGHEVFDFMDASRGYHQIRMINSIFAEYGLFCWKRMVNSIFAKQIGQNMEIYVDNMLMKSKKKAHHHGNLRETFEQLRASRLRITLKSVHLG
ncbi:hypothetical protein LIER_25263 [Lithospermum erythrorhizon]|uniref:Reverse transcriptase n=1 Tax=Lithospermum erythrorhizon TaxID=34254 RepID=A0AAV3R751_LITER